MNDVYICNAKAIFQVIVQAQAHTAKATGKLLFFVS